MTYFLNGIFWHNKSISTNFWKHLIRHQSRRCVRLENVKFSLCLHLENYQSLFQYFASRVFYALYTYNLHWNISTFFFINNQLPKLEKKSKSLKRKRITIIKCLAWEWMGNIFEEQIIRCFCCNCWSI